MARYVESALAGREAGTALPFATVRIADGAVVGSSRFFDIERWPWASGHAGARALGPGRLRNRHTWLAASAIRTATNTEAKLLMLTHAFESGACSGCVFTPTRATSARALALARIGARFEGVLRAHRLGADLTARDSARFSIVAAEWPGVKQRLRERLARA